MSVAGCEMGLDRGETDRQTDEQVGTLTRRTAKHCKPCTLSPIPLRRDTWNNILQTRTVRYVCRGFCLCHYACFPEEARTNVLYNAGRPPLSLPPPLTFLVLLYKSRVAESLFFFALRFFLLWHVPSCTWYLVNVPEKRKTQVFRPCSVGRSFGKTSPSSRFPSFP